MRKKCRIKTTGQVLELELFNGVYVDEFYPNGIPKTTYKPAVVEELDEDTIASINTDEYYQKCVELRDSSKSTLEKFKEFGEYQQTIDSADMKANVRADQRIVEIADEIETIMQELGDL